MSTRGVTLKQPWASLVVAGLKNIENRPWSTPHRGPLLIHAGKGQATTEELIRAADQFALYDDGATLILALRAGLLPAGAIIGQVELVDVVQGHSSPWAEPGAYHWVLANAVKFDTPVPYSGRQRLFYAPDPDADHLFKPHDGQTRRVCVTQEPADVMVTRPGKWGNPFVVKRNEGIDDWYCSGPPVKRGAQYQDRYAETKAGANAIAVRRFAEWLPRQEDLMSELPELRGERLGCFCRQGLRCHGDVLVKMVKEVEASK